MTKTRRLLTAAIAGVLLLSACGSDDDSSATTDAPAVEATDAPPVSDATSEPATTDEMTEDEMTEDEMTDDEMTEDEMAEDGTSVLVDELTAAGLTGDQAQCVVDGAVEEWGADALLASGSATDAQLVRLGEITFDCAS